MKKSLLVFLFYSFIAVTYAQVSVSNDFSYAVGKPYRVVDAPKKYYFSKGEEVMTIKIDGEKIIVQKLSSKTLSFIKQTEFEDLPKDYQLENITEFAGQYYFFYSLWEKPFEQLFVRKINFDKGVFEGPGTLLIKTDKKLSGMVTGSFGLFGRISVTDKFDFHLSYDKSKLLIQYCLKPEVRNDEKSFNVIGMYVFDKNLALSWNKEVTMPYTEKKMNNLDYSVDSEGNGYMLTTVYDDNSTDESKNGKANYHIELFKVAAKTGQLKISQVSLGDKFINRIWLYENANDHMLCGGYYTKTRNVDNADGLFLFKVNKSGTVYDLVSHEIPIAVLNQYESKSTQRKNLKKDKDDKAEFSELELRNLIVQDDGSVVLVGEQHYTVTHSYYTANGGWTYVTYSYFNDMLVAKIDNKGKLAWMQKLGKRQMGARSYGRGGMSFEYMFKDGNHYLVFLDNQKNMELSRDQVPATHSDGQGGFLTAYKVNDEKGTVSKLSLFNTRDVQGIEVFQFHTDRILPLDKAEFVVELYKKKKEDVLIKVTLKK
jgi:hypothetical protein